MNYYNIVGRVTAKVNQVLKNLGFKNIKNFQINYDTIDINMKDGPDASIKFLGPGVVGVYWAIEDFEARAAEREGENWEEVYDKTLFEQALHRMANKHDATIGISWDTIDVYLDDFCKY